MSCMGNDHSRGIASRGAATGVRFWLPVALSSLLARPARRVCRGRFGRAFLPPGVVLRGWPVAGEDAVEVFQRLVIELERHRALCILELPGGTRADDRPGYAVLVQQPGERDTARLLADLIAQVLVCLDLLAAALDGLLRPARQAAAPFAVLLEHSTKQAALQRGPGDDADAIGDRRGQDLHRLPDLIPRRIPVDVMHLVQVDVVGPQAPQRGVARAPDVERGKPVLIGPVTHRPVQLGSQHSALAAPAARREPVADDLFGPARMRLVVARDLARRAERAAVPIRGVEEVDAKIVRPVHDRVRVRGRGQGTDVHRAQAQAADAETGTAKMRVLHAPSFSCPRLTGTPGSACAAARSQIALLRAPLHDYYSSPPRRGRRTILPRLIQVLRPWRRGEA